MSVEHLLEHYRKQLGISEEQEAQFIEEQRAKNPVALLEKRVDADFINLDERTKGMQDVDNYTLGHAFMLDDRTGGMQDIDNYTLDLVFQLMARIDVLEQEVQTLKGGV